MINNMDNKIQVLGAYGTKAKGCGTSSIFINSKNVIDAGNLLDPLEIDSVDIENIWLTHSHLDHIVDIAYILDSYFTQRKKSLNIIGLPETIRAIKENFLNDTIWPDFSKIKLFLSDEMAIRYTELNVSQKYKLSATESLRAFKTDHTVDSCGYIYTKNNKSIMITADTYSLDNVIKELEEDLSITTLIIECSFANSMRQLAIDSKHLTPELLFEKLEILKREDINIYINHIKPSYLKIITEQIEENRGSRKPKILKDGEFVHF